jgi:hypothetical protein
MKDGHATIHDAQRKEKDLQWAKVQQVVDESFEGLIVLGNS